MEHTRTGGFAAWDGAVAAVWLHGSAGVVVAATELDEAVGQLFYAAADRRIHDRDDWNKARRPAREAFERFIAAARNELDLPSVPVRIFTDPPVHDNTPPSGRDTVSSGGHGDHRAMIFIMSICPSREDEGS